MKEKSNKETSNNNSPFQRERVEKPLNFFYYFFALYFGQKRYYGCCMCFDLVTVLCSETILHFTFSEICFLVTLNSSEIKG